MRLLLGSGGFGTEERRTHLCERMRDHFGGIKSILFIPWALDDHDGYLKAMRERGFDAGYRLEGIHEHADPLRAVEEAEAIYVGGGNSFRLVERIHREGLLEPVRNRVIGGMRFMGVSAGTNSACPTMMTSNDMPIVLPPSFETFGLVGFQINPHYYSGHTWVKKGDDLVEHLGETRDQRIKEFHERNPHPVLGLFEGGILEVRDGKMSLTGSAAREFRAGAEPVDHADGADLSALLQSCARDAAVG